MDIGGGLLSINELLYQRIESLEVKSRLETEIDIVFMGQPNKFRMLLREYEPNDSNIMFDLLLQKDTISYVCQIHPKVLRPMEKTDRLNLNLTTPNILDIFKKLFFSDSQLENFSYEFLFSLPSASSEDGMFWRPKSKSTSSQNGKKRRKVVKDVKENDIWANYNLDLKLVITFTPPYFDPIELSFLFFTIPSFPVDTLPNEIYITIFRFLDTFFLMKSVSLVNKRFNQLIESEFMYQKHHFVSLPMVTSEERTQGTSWREYTKMCWTKRCRWTCLPYKGITNPVNIQNLDQNFRKIRVTGFKDECFSVFGSDAKQRGLSVCTSNTVLGTGSYEWKIRFSKESEDGTLFWVGMITDLNGANSSGYSEESYSFNLSTGEIHAVGRFGQFEFFGGEFENHLSAPTEFDFTVTLSNGKVKIKCMKVEGWYALLESDLEKKFRLSVDVGDMEGVELEILSFRRI